MVLTNRTCAAINDADAYTADNDPFFDGHWDAHKIGWLITGVCAVVSLVISSFTFWMHARNYYKPRQQRQILRILLMPPVYAILSFFSYRYYTSYTYWEFGTVAYESLVLAAFLLLLLQFIGESNEEQRAILQEKEKHKIPFPFCCIRYRPSKPYFLHALKWSVLQYSFIRPAISIAGIITNYYGVLCPTGYSIYYAEVYLDSIDFVSISVALYGLIVFGALCRKQMDGQQPLAKFLSIKGIVMITFYQSFIFEILQDYDVIKATDYWTATNVSDGLQALCTCVEMVIFSAVFVWAFSWKQYKAARPAGAKHTSFWRATLNSLNYSDFLAEAWLGLVFAWDFVRRRPGTRASEGGMNIQAAFSGEGEFEKDGHPGLTGGGPASPRSDTPITRPWDGQGQGQRQAAGSGLPAGAFGGRGSGEYQGSRYNSGPYGGGGGREDEQAYPMEERAGHYSQQQQQYQGQHQQRQQDGYAGYAQEDPYASHHQQQQQQQPSYQQGAYAPEDRDYYEPQGQPARGYYPPPAQGRQQQQAYSSNRYNPQQHGSYYGEAN